MKKELTNREKKELARVLYLVNNDTTNKSIAQTVGITEKTMGKWVVSEGWDTEKEVKAFSRNKLLPVLIKQYKRMIDAIENHEDEKKKFGSSKDYDAMIKLNAVIKSFEDTPLSVIVDIIIRFQDFIKTIDVNFAKQVSEYADQFIKNSTKV